MASRLWLIIPSKQAVQKAGISQLSVSIRNGRGRKWHMDCMKREVEQNSVQFG
jgi:hypothetical protein